MTGGQQPEIKERRSDQERQPEKRAEENDDGLSDAKETVDFVTLVTRGEFASLVAIDPGDGKITTKWFDRGDADGVADWRDKYDGTWNLYYAVNEPKERQNKKAKKEDIAVAHWLHADIDPADGVDRDEARATIRERLDAFPLRPTAVVDSGNGFNALWLLREPVENVERVEAANKEIAAALGGDAGTWNLDRILRLPGTTNLPTKMKREKGRVARPARLIYFEPEREYDLADFEALPAGVEGAADGPIGGERSDDQPDWWPEFEAVLESDADVARRWRGDAAKLNDKTRSGLDASLSQLLIKRHAKKFDKAKRAVILRRFPYGKAAERKAEYIERLEAMGGGAWDGPVLDPRDPHATAVAFVEARYTTGGRATLVHHGGVFRDYVGTHYEIVNPAKLRAAVYRYLDAAAATDKYGNAERFKPTRNRVDDVVDALKAATELQGVNVNAKLPLWLDGPGGHPPAGEFVSCANGLLHVGGRPGMLYPHTPDFFCVNSLPFDYDPDAGPPERLHEFLESILPGDFESQRCLAEMCGYVISGDTDLQKILMIVGPRRCGKGTIARALTGLVGADNMSSPTLASLAGDFGLQPLLDKSLAVISDARMDGRTNQRAVAEQLLSISGEDGKSVPLKYRDAWEGRLGVRFLVLTNEIPRIADASLALPGRFVPIVLRESFYGREDVGLTDKLLAELPAILNWALEGYDTLRDRGHFKLPEASADAVRDLEDLASPVAAFVRDECVVETTAEVAKDQLFKIFKDWAAEADMKKTDRATFFRDLKAHLPGIQERRATRDDEGKRPRYFVGLRTTRLWDDDNVPPIDG